MQFSEDAIKRLITAIGYAPQDGKSGIYLKSYQNHDGYCIFVDFNNQQIIYDSDENPSGVAIKVWERTTSNFSQSENFVVLECVDSLLEKGYAPSCIELEKTYPSGHGRSGRLDILVKSVDDVPFLMIECKTWGAEFDKEQSKMLKNGGQLFTYYANDRATEFLCLYASQINGQVYQALRKFLIIGTKTSKTTVFSTVMLRHMMLSIGHLRMANWKPSRKNIVGKSTTKLWRYCAIMPFLISPMPLISC